MNTDENPNENELFLESLDMNFPVIPLNPDYKIVPYKAGDIDTWISIQSQTEKFIEITKELYYRNFGDDDEILSQRQFFLIDNKTNKAIGTTTAWFLFLDEHCTAEKWGRVHWVCILPEYQGKGLGKALVSFTLEKLKELGHTEIFLDTDIRRQNAVHIYKSFGFKEQDKEFIKVIKRYHNLALYKKD